MPKVTKIQQPQPAIPPRVKVAAYARVSMGTEQPMHSLSAQVSYYSEIIQNTPEWEYAGVYVDAGLTGTSKEVRPEFLRLIADCEAGKINIVLTKSISRFARNTVDLLTTVRRLKELGVEVRFEREHINSLSGDGEVMLSILASFAQEESMSLSRNIKWSIRKKFEEGRVSSRGKMLGYEWQGDKMIIVPDEAETVRFIFNSFISGISTLQIAKELQERGIMSVRGKPFPEVSVRKILHNEQYTGCLILQQSFNYRPNKQKLNYGEMPMYRVDDHHPAIISAEIFQQAEVVRLRRSEAAKRDPQFKSAFAGLVWCGKCGHRASWHRTPQSRKRGDMSSMIWICYSKNNKKGCDCRNTKDKDFQAAVDSFGLEINQIEKIEMFDEKFVFTLKTGRKKTWRR